LKTPSNSSSEGRKQPILTLNRALDEATHVACLVAGEKLH
jgi:hypothetical protein